MFPGQEAGHLRSTTVDLREQILGIVREENYAKLFAHLCNPDSPVQSLLLRHPDDLFPKLDPDNAAIPPEFSLSVPLFLWMTPTTPSSFPPSRPTILNWIDQESSGVEGSESGEAADEPEEVKALFAEGTFEELVLLNGLRIVQHNPHLLRLAQGRDPVTLPEVRRALGQEGLDLHPIEDEVLVLMGNIAEQEGIGSIFKALLRRSRGDTESAYEIKKMVHEAYQYLRQVLAEAPGFAGELHRLLPAIARKGAPFLETHNQFVRWVYGGTASKDLDALDALWALDLLRPMVIILACERCKDSEGKPVCAVLSSDVAPSEFRVRPVCPLCTRTATVQAFYGIDGWLQRWINSQDGLLAYAVAYLLETNGLSWEAQVQAAGSEHDFHVRTKAGVHLLECKVFRCSAPIRSDPALTGKVKQAISQVVEHAVESGATRGTLVCHPFPFPHRVSRQLVARDLRRRGLYGDDLEIRVLGPRQFRALLKGME